MQRIEKQIKLIKEQKRLGLMTHIVAGFPSYAESKKIAKALAENGSDFIEIQIPFSDPMADGPTIMQANKVALDNGFKVKIAFQLMSELSAEVDIPLLFMSYANILINYGVEKFCHDAQAAGCSGLIIPDLPISEEAYEHLHKYAQKYNLANICLLAPTSNAERIKQNSKYSRDFIYYVSRKGITGDKQTLSKTLHKELKLVRKYIKIPIAVGFGIKNAADVKSLQGIADIAVVGSAMLEAYNQNNIAGVITKSKELAANLN